MRTQNETQNENLEKEETKVKFNFKKAMRNAKHKVADWINGLGMTEYKVIVKTNNDYILETKKTELTKDELDQALGCNAVLVMYGRKLVLNTTDLKLLEIVETLELESEDE